jgi:hypothetical protein
MQLRRQTLHAAGLGLEHPLTPPHLLPQVSRAALSSAAPPPSPHTHSSPAATLLAQCALHAPYAKRFAPRIVVP